MVKIMSDSGFLFRMLMISTLLLAILFTGIETSSVRHRKEIYERIKVIKSFERANHRSFKIRNFPQKDLILKDFYYYQREPFVCDL